MFAYESGSPAKPGDSNGINVELSTRDVKRWRELDPDVIRDAERCALINGLKGKKVQYFIKGAGYLILAHGFIEDLQRKYPDVTENSPS